MGNLGLPLDPVVSACAVENVACLQGPEEGRDVLGRQRELRIADGRQGRGRGDPGSQRGPVAGEDNGFSALRHANEMCMEHPC